MKIFPFLLFLAALLGYRCDSVNFPNKKEVRQIRENPSSMDAYLQRIKLPPGFKISVFAEDIPNARSLSLSAKGTLFVGTRSGGQVFALRDENGDFKAEKKYVIAQDLRQPNGVAFKDGDLFVAEISRILKFEDIENKLASPPQPVVVYDKYPTDGAHGWKYIAFGPEGKLYVPVGAPCNICESKEIYATITRMNPDGTGFEIVQRGIRNTVGFSWHPSTGELWFTENGRDWSGDDIPADELNHAPELDMHFGYPYCHQGNLADDKFGKNRTCTEFTPPVQNLGPHVAALGMEFYTGKMFPENYRNQVFIAEHGSWNRSKKIGYRVTLVTLDGNRATSYEPFASGWLDEAADQAWGRPVDLEHLPDGSLLVSDDFAGVIYRIVYQP